MAGARAGSGVFAWGRVGYDMPVFRTELVSTRRLSPAEDSVKAITEAG